MLFTDRKEAGQKLVKTEALKKLKGAKDVVVLGVPRGGVVTAAEVAKLLNVPLDVVIARKIGAPADPEFALGAVGEKGEVYLNPDVSYEYTKDNPYIKEEIARQREEVKRRLKLFRGNKKPVSLKNKIVIIVDDGIATGSTMIAAIHSVKEEKPKKVIVAIPVAPTESIEEIKKEADEVVCLSISDFFFAVGQFYSSFEQTEDREVKEILGSSVTSDKG